MYRSETEKMQQCNANRNMSEAMNDEEILNIINVLNVLDIIQLKKLLLSLHSLREKVRKL